MPGKAPAQQSTEPTAVAKPSSAQNMLIKMAGMAAVNNDDRRTSIEDLNVILEASEEEFWDSDERASINAKTLSGCVIEISGFVVKYGEGAVGDDDIVTPFVDPKNGRQMYLLVDSTIIDKRGQNKLYVLPKEHEPFQWNTSARYIVAKLYRMMAFGWFDDGHSPVRVLVKGTPIKGGKQQVEKLKLPDGGPIVMGQTLPNQESDEPPF